ncbi:hypothetical protein [Gordonia malaquae]|uniref:hypothetical protein n=1 Tax=Gordonia malaquae TaxID=410332 RepID=UPI0030FE1182
MLVAIGSAAVLVLVITLIATSGGDGPKRTNTRTTETTQRASLDEALDAVCKPGSFVNGRDTPLRNADASGLCIARERTLYLFIGTYVSAYEVKTDTSTGYVGAFAVGTLSDGQTLVIANQTSSVAMTTLEPLRNMGFALNNAPS